MALSVLLGGIAAIGGVLLATWLLHWVLAWSWIARLGLVVGAGLLVAVIGFVRFLANPESYR